MSCGEYSRTHIMFCKKQSRLQKKQSRSLKTSHVPTKTEKLFCIKSCLLYIKFLLKLVMLEGLLSNALAFVDFSLNSNTEKKG